MWAKVYRSSQRVFECKLLDVDCADNGKIVSATALGMLLKEGEIVTGDLVELETNKGTGTLDSDYVITKVAERKNQIYRISQRESRKKITAANCDYVAVITSVSLPVFKRGILDRFIVRSFQWKIPAIVIFNKMDQFVEYEKEFDLAFEAKRMTSLNVPCYEISAHQPEYVPRIIIEDPLQSSFFHLQQRIRGKTVAFLGQSGVGKSRIIGALTGGHIKLKSQDISRASKGSHTTSWSEIIEFDDFCMIDSPGIRSFSLEDILEEELIDYYPDVSEVARKCMFSNCQHHQDSKGCAFYSHDSGAGAGAGAVFTSDEEKRILISRLESYLQIKEELANQPSWSKKDRY
ncbi:MAG: ribosome small subunit-dependent GTPase A [Oligoflexia bacterium]|nr:ribosome small subunit-dependent GTPase A [Oligoflexia bacterium]